MRPKIKDRTFTIDLDNDPLAPYAMEAYRDALVRESADDAEIDLVAEINQYLIDIGHEESGDDNQ